MVKRRITRQSAKAKGRDFQYWVCEQISNLLNIPWGSEELIASREASTAGTDVKLIGEAKQKFPFSVECKRYEKWDVQGWIKQAKRNQEEGTDWLLFIKRNHMDPVVVMDAERFFELLGKQGENNE